MRGINEHKQIKLRVLSNTCPFLRLSLEFRSFCLCLLINHNIHHQNRLYVQRLDITGVRIWQGVSRCGKGVEWQGVEGDNLNVSAASD